MWRYDPRRNQHCTRKTVASCSRPLVWFAWVFILSGKWHHTIIFRTKGKSTNQSIARSSRLALFIMGKLCFYPTFQKVELNNSTFFQWKFTRRRDIKKSRFVRWVDAAYRLNVKMYVYGRAKLEKNFDNTRTHKGKSELAEICTEHTLQL